MYELMFRSKSINRFGSPRDVSGDKGSDSEGEIGAGRKIGTVLVIVLRVLIL